MTKHNVQIFGVRPFFKSSTNQHLAVKLWKMRCRTPKQHNILTSWHNHLKANKWPASHFLPVVDSCNLVFYAQSTSVSGQVVDRYQARSFHFTMPYFVLLTDTRPSHHAWLCLVDRYLAKSSCLTLSCWQIPGQVIMPDFVLLTDTRPSHHAWLCLVDRYQAKSSCLTLSCWQIPGQVLLLHHAWLCLVDRYQAKSFHFIMPLSCWQILGQVIMPDFVLLTDTRPSPSTSSCLTLSCWQIPGQVLPFHHAILPDRYNGTDWQWRTDRHC